jgi:hypothetical protein
MRIEVRARVEIATQLFRAGGQLDLPRFPILWDNQGWSLEDFQILPCRVVTLLTRAAKSSDILEVRAPSADDKDVSDAGRTLKRRLRYQSSWVLLWSSVLRAVRMLSALLWALLHALLRAAVVLRAKPMLCASGLLRSSVLSAMSWRSASHGRALRKPLLSHPLLAMPGWPSHSLQYGMASPRCHERWSKAASPLVFIGGDHGSA